MLLSECRPADVVQNSSNRNFYRYERPDADRIRIRPLELFPNGLLISKPTDTTVEGDLKVAFVAPWTNELYVVIQPGDCKRRQTFEQERERKRLELQELQQEALVIPAGQRGSHANKIKAVVVRLAVLNRGLSDPPSTAPTQAFPVSEMPVYTEGQVVRLPSGHAASFLGMVTTGIDTLARVRNKAGSFCIQPEVLTPIHNRWISTV